MRNRVRVSVLAVVAAVAAVMTPLAPSQAASDEWVVDAEPSASVDVRYYMHKHVAGHPGNWQVLAVRVQQDDDGVVGNLASLRCPKGEQPDPVTGLGDCVEVAGADFVDELGITVTWSPQLRRMHIVGDIILNDYTNGVLVPSTIDLRVLASGELTRTVIRQSFTEPDPWDYKTIHRERGDVTARGNVGWLRASPTPITFNDPIHVYEAYSRGYGDGV